VGQDTQDGNRLGGHADIDGVRAWKVIGPAELPPGLSGGLMLDLSRGVVSAVVKAQRLANTNMGGLVIPAELVQHYFPDVWRDNQEFDDRNRRWYELRAAILDSHPAGLGPNPEEWGFLSRMVGNYALSRREFNELWISVTGGVMLQPPRPYYSMGDLVEALADSMRNGLDPLTRLFVCMAYAPWMPPPGQDSDDRDQLLSLARRRVRSDGSDGREFDFALYQAQWITMSATKRAQKRPVVVIRLVPDPPDSRKDAKLEIWTYADRGAQPQPVTCPPGPYRISSLQTVTEIIKILRKQVESLPPGADPLIEFALPDHMLDIAVEDWRWERDLTIGDFYPVVVRLADRTDPAHVREWKTHGPFWHAGARVPTPQDKKAWTGLWVTCHGTPALRDMYQALREVGVPMMAMTSWHGGTRVKMALDVAKMAGTSVIVWRHKSCSPHGCPVLNGGGPCPGAMFQQLVAGGLSGEHLSDLPDKVFDLRRQPGGSETAILWDDPGRYPWEGGPPLGIEVGEQGGRR
jgi:hypothetical protein